MSLFTRIKNIFIESEPPQPEKTVLTLTNGDVCEVSMIVYQVIGKIQNHSRSSVMFTLQDGSMLRYLFIEDREQTNYILYTPIDGRMDSAEEVPTSIELDNRMYHLEEHYEGHLSCVGKTPFTQTAREHYVWQYQSDDMHYLRVEWQDGRFMLYEGEPILPADVNVIRGS